MEHIGFVRCMIAVLFFLSIVLLIFTIIDRLRKLSEDTTKLSFMLDLFKAINLICISLPVIVILGYSIYSTIYIAVTGETPTIPLPGGIDNI
jgi:hypothetical protein